MTSARGMSELSQIKHFYPPVLMTLYVSRFFCSINKMFNQLICFEKREKMHILMSYDAVLLEVQGTPSVCSVTITLFQ